VGIYETYYNCRSEPFSLSPDPRFLYLSPSHREALAQLQYLVELRKGFAVLTGEVGLGKTTLLRTLLEHLGSQVRSGYIFNPPRSVAELYAAIGDELNVNLDGLASPVITLNRLLTEIFRRGETVALIFDEAQRLPIEVLEEIRLLSNLESSDSKLLQVILAGQPELDTLLETPQLRALRQRVVMRYSLAPLGMEDTISYIATRVRVAGAERSPFLLDACRSIYRLSGGVPRLINLICDNALLSSYAADRPQVDRKCVEAVARELRIDPSAVRNAPRQAPSNLQNRPVTQARRRSGKRWTAAALLLILLVASVVASFVYFANEKEHWAVQASLRWSYAERPSHHRLCTRFRGLQHKFAHDYAIRVDHV
jgi:general secretion pathway protein A